MSVWRAVNWDLIVGVVLGTGAMVVFVLARGWFNAQ